MKLNLDRDTPLHVAAWVGRPGVVSSLLKLIIDQPALDMETQGNGRLKMLRRGNKKDNAALHEAIAYWE